MLSSEDEISELLEVSELEVSLDSSELVSLEAAYESSELAEDVTSDEEAGYGAA